MEYTLTISDAFPFEYGYSISVSEQCKGTNVHHITFPVVNLHTAALTIEQTTFNGKSRVVIRYEPEKLTKVPMGAKFIEVKSIHKREIPFVEAIELFPNAVNVRAGVNGGLAFITIHEATEPQVKNLYRGV